MKTLIVVPARYGSTRLPGKPLIEIAGTSMVRRVAEAARRAASELPDAGVVIATDDDRILAHCDMHGLPAVMTDPGLPSGSDRALAAADAVGSDASIIVNLQGDAPFTPTQHIVAVARAAGTSGADAATPYVRLTWDALDQLRAHKRATPFSGTTLTHDSNGRALWFSKSILPAIRKEDTLRSKDDQSPVCRHIGLYAYTRAALQRFVALPEGHYETLEGLEQLRLIENGMHIQCVEVTPPAISIPGIDTAEDVALAEKLIAEHGIDH